MRVLCVVPQNIKHETVQFVALKTLGVELHVITCQKSEPDYQQLIDMRIPVEIVPIRKRVDSNAVKRIRDMIKKQNIDIVHAFNNRTISNALRACKGLSVKFIAYRGIVGNVSFFNPASWQTYLNPRVDKIICVAEAIRQHLLELKCMGLGIPAEKLVTVHKGHDLNWYQGTPRNLSEFGVPENAFVVGCTATYRPRKGIEILVKALDHLPASANIHILLIGNMNSKGLKKLIDSSRYTDRIHLIGHQANAPEIQAACNICVLPSLKREGLPKTVIEGMAYGIPAIVTNSGGSPELVDHMVSGIVVEPGSVEELASAILKFFENPEFCKSAGTAAKHKIATEFTVARTVEQTYQIYKELYSG